MILLHSRAGLACVRRASSTGVCPGTRAGAANVDRGRLSKIAQSVSISIFMGFRRPASLVCRRTSSIIETQLQPPSPGRTRAPAARALVPGTQLGVCRTAPCDRLPPLATPPCVPWTPAAVSGRAQNVRPRHVRNHASVCKWGRIACVSKRGGGGDRCTPASTRLMPSGRGRITPLPPRHSHHTRARAHTPALQAPQCGRGQ